MKELLNIPAYCREEEEKSTNRPKEKEYRLKEKDRDLLNKSRKPTQTKPKQPKKVVRDVPKSKSDPSYFMSM